VTAQRHCAAQRRNARPKETQCEKKSNQMKEKTRGEMIDYCGTLCHSTPTIDLEGAVSDELGHP
jgi:hypothetical protein